jgi:hypothetical protein
VFVGLHYPGDVGAGALIGFAAAFMVYRAADQRWVPVVRVLSRVTDPVVVPFWKALDAYTGRRRARW